MLTDVDGNDWGALHAGKLTWSDIEAEIRNPGWQAVRLAMKGVSTSRKWEMCRDYRRENENSLHSRIVVTNYINALKRAGIVFEVA